MSVAYQDIPSQEAWLPLPRDEWNAETAGHFLRRVGFAAPPAGVARLLEKRPEELVEWFFGDIRGMPQPYRMAQFREEWVPRYREMRTLPEGERQKVRQEAQRASREVVADFGIAWLRFARDPRLSPQEKMVSFLADVFVVATPKVRNPWFLFQHQAILRQHLTGDFGDLCKAVSRSPAMIQYLDLQQSRRGAANENFARELFELFMLGEGHYTEEDIKEAARAFTGYQVTPEGFRFNPRRFDGGAKTIFGRRGRHDGDDVIDLALREDAAATFLPTELWRYYGSHDEPLDPVYLERLGAIWRESDFNLGTLYRTVFCSRLFFHPSFRGNRIKSPLEFYLGLLQELDLDVTPTAGGCLQPLRSMGQPLFQPPNVRGWVGGKHWINSSTLAARRQLVRLLFTPINDDALNADDYVEIMTARANGEGNHRIDGERLAGLLDAAGRDAADQLVRYFLPIEPVRDFRDALADAIDTGEGSRRRRLTDAVVSLLQSAPYQLT